MKHLAQCVIRYAQCLWQAQPLLSPDPAPAGIAAHSEEPVQAAKLADAYLAGLVAALAALPADQRATLSIAARIGLRPVPISQHQADPVREALIASKIPIPPRTPATAVAPWHDDSLAAIALRSLCYALDLTDALPDPHANTPMSGPSSNQYAKLWAAAHVLEDQQAALWDAVEAVTAEEASILAEAARDAVTHVDPEGQQAELLAYFASGMFAQRVQARS